MTTPQPAALPELNPADIVVDVVCRALGGFAPVNTNGVRVTHKPSGVSVTVDSERSQHKNKHLAWEKLCAILALRPRAVPMTLPPVEGDVLPAIGSKVLIHLASSDSWAEREVVGYYVWEAINELAKPRHHRVFVRVRDTDGILNARHICDLRDITAQGAQGEPN